MIKKVTYSVPTHNPFNDSMVDVMGEFECHCDGQKIDFIDVISVVTDSEVEMVDYLSEEEKEKLTDYIFENYRGEI